MRFQQLLTSMYPSKRTENIRPTYYTSWDRWKHLPASTMCSMIHSELIVQVGCYSFHFDLTLTTYSSGLPTSFRYHLLFHLHNSRSWLHKHLCKVQADLNLVERQALQPMRHPLRHSNDRDISQSTTMMPTQPPQI